MSIDAHEQERSRLSRELHDGVAQRVALLSIDLMALRERVTDATREMQDGLNRISAEVAELGSELYRLSHALHPARLEQLGLAASLRSLCAEFERARRMTGQVEIAGPLAPIDMDAALCLYRIAQEALHNIVKHSGATCATVALTSDGGEIALRVSDNGVGFDPESLPENGALGLVSMRERAALARARLLVSSRPG